MNFNTAILYDIENLIGGYGNADMLSSLSLRDIYDEIVKKEIGKIAIQRAYANWSDPRLNILRGDIVELGIEPIQVFGFGRGPQKNASDIQLAIDAIDIAFTRKAIEIYIIVSGDGGFSSLAKKLHEYGYAVIGCAYKRVTNKVFEAVCDDFIWIDEPKEEYPESQEPSEFTDPILIEYSRKFRPIENAGREEIINKSKEILGFLVKNRDSARLLRDVGLNISIFSQALTYRIVNFNYMALGFTRFTDFIRYVSNGTEIKLVHNPPSEYRLLHCNSSLTGFEDIPYISELGEIHTLENYLTLLSRGIPSFRLPDRVVLSSISQHLCVNREKYQDVMLGDIIDDISSEALFEQKEIKGCVLSLVSADCFIRKPEDAKLSEQKLSFVPQTLEETMETLKNAMRRKLVALLGEIHEEILEEII